MGLLDNRNLLVSPKTGFEGSKFKQVESNNDYDVFIWDKESSGMTLRLTYRDIFAWSNDNALYIVYKGEITDTPTEIVVNDTNFPNLRKNTTTNKFPVIERVIACPCYFATSNNNTRYGSQTYFGGSECRVCVIFNNGQIYHNFPSHYNEYDFYNIYTAKEGSTTLVSSLYKKFDESVIWDIKGRKNPTNNAELVATGAYYYNPALPSSCYEFHPAISQANGYGNTVGFPATNNVNNASDGIDIGLRARFFMPDYDDANCNSFSYMGGYVCRNNFTMIGTYRDNGTKAARICVFGTQDGGRSWYNMYEFAAQDRLKVGSEYVAPSGWNGIPLAQTGTESNASLYKVTRRALIVPTETQKEPNELFEFANEVTIKSIVGTSDSITFTTATAHGLGNGDAVVIGLQQGVSTNNRTFDWMVNNTASSTSGGNGVLFKVYDCTATTFKVKLYAHNPHSNIPIRHIHALNLCKDGVSVSGGENYPTGGWILYLPIRFADGFSHWNVADAETNRFLRLNSTKDSFARPLGMILQQECDKTYCYIGNDHATIPNREATMPEGRTDTFEHNSTGVWKVELEGIDSLANNGKILLNTYQVCYGFQQMLNALVFVGEFGELSISKDLGDTWTSMVLPYGNWAQNSAHFSGPTYQRQFSMDNVVVQLK